MAVFLGIAIGSLFAIAVGFTIKKIHVNNENDEKSKAWIFSGITAVILLCIFIIVPFSLHTVNTGEVALVKEFGKAKEVKTAGLYFDLWVTKKYEKYDTKIQKMEIETSTYSSDAQTMDIEMTVQYQIEAEKVFDIAKNYGSLETLQQKIESIVIEQTKAVLSAHKAMNIIANRAAMSPTIEEAIRKTIGEKYYITISTVVVTDIEFSEAFETAVENKMIAEQQQLKAEYDNKTKIETAEANAKAKILTAQAEKEANELLQKSLTPEILKEEWIKKWNGKLPSTLAGEDTNIAIVP